MRRTAGGADAPQTLVMCGFLHPVLPKILCQLNDGSEKHPPTPPQFGSPLGGLQDPRSGIFLEPYDFVSNLKTLLL